MKKATKIVFIILFIVMITGSFIAGNQTKEKEYRNMRIQKCNTLITFAIDKVENYDFSEKGTKEALISNVYAAYHFCDDSYLAQQLYDLWNTLLFEPDYCIDKKNILISQLKEISETIKK